MDLIAKLLPQFIADLPVQTRKIVYAILVILGVIILADYKFAAGSGISWVDTHVVSASVLAWFIALVTPVILMAHQKAQLTPTEEEVWGALDPALTTAAAPAADVPNAAIAAAQTAGTPEPESVPPSATPVDPAAPPVAAS